MLPKLPWEDASAATALYKALQEKGLWLDLAEMRGGDRIDEKIGPNVQRAAFFLPLLSVNTLGKGGYFRREWAWAIKHNANFTGIADRGYLRPIIVDTTQKEDFKEVPADFTDVHIEIWPQGKPTPEFLAQILEADRRWARPISAT
jgi:TIR domain